MELREEKAMTDTTNVPEEIKGLNWGAFFLSWIWGIFNGVWLALLCLVPCVNIVMIFVLLFKGNEWAWRAKPWPSVEEFQRVQRLWTKWGVGLFLLVVALGVIGAVLGVIGAIMAGNN